LFGGGGDAEEDEEEAEAEVVGTEEKELAVACFGEAETGEEVPSELAALICNADIGGGKRSTADGGDVLLLLTALTVGGGGGEVPNFDECGGGGGDFAVLIVGDSGGVDGLLFVAVAVSCGGVVGECPSALNCLISFGGGGGTAESPFFFFFFRSTSTRYCGFSQTVSFVNSFSQYARPPTPRCSVHIS
jgi:hypothetical protein